VGLHLHERLALLLQVSVLQQLLGSFLGAYTGQPPACQYWGVPAINNIQWVILLSVAPPHAMTAVRMFRLTAARYVAASSSDMPCITFGQYTGMSGDWYSNNSPDASQRTCPQRGVCGRQISNDSRAHVQAHGSQTCSRFHTGEIEMYHAR